MFLNHIKRVRMSSGKTQAEVADFLKITQSAYSKIETKMIPPIDVVFNLSEYFKVPVTELYSKQ